MTSYKSLFILHVYYYACWDPKPNYNIDKDEFKLSPGFHIEELETGYYQTLSDAQKRIRQLAKNKHDNVYCFLVEEKPMDFPLGCSARLSCRRYLSNGKLWQEDSISNIHFKGGKRCRLGDTCFHGRDPKTILFEEGDIVELVRNNFVELAIVWKMPATVEQVGAYLKLQQQRKRFDPVVQCIGNLSDRYTLVGYSESENGEITCWHFDYPVADVLPASRPISKKIAAELRQQLKVAKASDDDELPF